MKNESSLILFSLQDDEMVLISKKNLLCLDPKDNIILPHIGVYIITSLKPNNAALSKHVLLGRGVSLF